MFDLNKLKSIKIGLASPEQIASWGHGEVTKPETINYRSQKPEPDGLFCEKIFGPVKDYECHCGHYKKASFAGKVCEKCGVEVTLKAVRRERMGYIKLAFPCAHIWYVKGSPSKMGLVLGVAPKELEEVIYFVSHIVLNPGNSKVLKYREVLDENEAREVFHQVIENEILSGENCRLKEGDRDFVRGTDLMNHISRKSQPFDFVTVSRFITRYTGAKFGIGAEAVLQLLKEIDLDKEIEIVRKDLESTSGDKNQKRIKAIKRLEVLEAFRNSEIKPEWMVLSVLPVIPPDLRPMMQLDGGRYATSDLNDLYRQVIIKNNRLKREIEEHAPSVILLNEKRMLQEAVDALIDNERRSKPSQSISGNTLRSLSSTLKGKQGRFRQNLLGKRVDYSGRSVIAVGPELDMDECGLPREMAVQLFRPFIAHYLIAQKDSNVTSQRQADEMIARKDSRVYDAIEKIIENHPVLLNRAPTLHRLGIQAFRPTLIEGKAIRLHPLVCPGFNADFDGDQMAVHVPLSRQAQAEAMSLMLANHNILKPSDGQPICVPSQDMIYGNYYLTLEDDQDQDDDYAKYYEKRGEMDMHDKFISYKQYEGKVFSDPDTAILAYQNGIISLRTRIYVPASSLRKDWINDEKYASIRSSHYLIAQKDSNVTSQRQADEMIARKDSRVYDAIEKIIENHPVLLNRAPTLHRLGIQAFRPTLIEGKAIRLHPLVCPGFNADFDGDQMAVHVPLSRQAQAEAMSLMLANHNILKPSDGQPICVPSQDMIYGNYYLTLEDDQDQDDDYAKYYEKRGEMDMHDKFISYKQYEGKVFSDPDTAILAYQNGIISLRTRIYVPASSLRKDWINDEKYASIRSSYLLTTVGKLIFNDIFPTDFPYINFAFSAASLKKRGMKVDKAALKKELSKNFDETPLDFFISAKQAYDAVIKSGKFKAGDDFNPFKEYVKLVPTRSPIEKKGIKTMMDYVFRRYGAVETAKIMDLFKNQGFDYCTKSGLTISLDDMQPLSGRDELYKHCYEEVQEINENFELGFYTDEERHDAVISHWNAVKDTSMKEKLHQRMASAPRNPMFMMMESGARGSEDNYMQLIGMKGCMLDSTGRAIEVPVTDCYADGLSVSEYFTSTHGTRKNGSDTALKTADSGYLTRKLVDVSHNVVIREEDCHCDHGIEVYTILDSSNQVIASLYNRIVGRYSMHDVVNPKTGEVIVPGNTFIDEELAQKVVDAGIEKVEIRSILTCESTDGVCVHCYGRNLATGQIATIGDTVGIMAAQSIGEPGTQLTLKNFHTGGVAGVKDITTGLPRVQELLEVRNPKPKSQALISTIRGTVTDIKEVGLRHEFTVKNELEEQKFLSYPSAVPEVKKGDVIRAGQSLTKGHVNPKELLECTDLLTLRRYLIQEVKEVYSSNGIDISDKHLEIIVRQMTNRLLIINPGNTDMLPGQRVNDIVFTEKNKKVLAHGGNPAVGRPIVMGITKAALDTESFLSSASFQETTRVLTDAAIKGKVDYLRGLKENVMIGKLIPAGTGIEPILSEEDAEKDASEVVSQETLLKSSNSIVVADAKAEISVNQKQ